MSSCIYVGEEGLLLPQIFLSLGTWFLLQARGSATTIPCCSASKGQLRNEPHLPVLACRVRAHQAPSSQVELHSLSSKLPGRLGSIACMPSIAPRWWLLRHDAVDSLAGKENMTVAWSWFTTFLKHARHTLSSTSNWNHPPPH